MKTNLLFAIGGLLLLTASAKSQTIGGTPLKEIKSKYLEVELECYRSNRYFLNIDYGQLQRSSSTFDTRLLTDDGGPMLFNTMIEALNFLDGYGYDYLDALPETSGEGDITHYRYMLVKKAGN